jgi:hypothetical protein
MATVAEYAGLIGRLVLKMLLVSVVILALAGGYCLVTGGWTLARFVNAATILGLLTAALGALSAGGSARLGADRGYQVARTAGHSGTGVRTGQDVADSEKRIGFTWLMAGGGLGAVAAAYALSVLVAR